MAHTNYGFPQAAVEPPVCLVEVAPVRVPTQPAPAPLVEVAPVVELAPVEPVLVPAVESVPEVESIPEVELVPVAIEPAFMLPETTNA